LPRRTIADVAAVHAQARAGGTKTLLRLAELAYIKVVIPAKAGIQGKRQWSLDSGFRRNDGSEAGTVGYSYNAQ
jgi:hypothetical protein